MFGLGILEIALILVVALLVLGPEKLPKVARQLGKGVREVRRAARELQVAIDDSTHEVKREVERLDEPTVSRKPTQSIETNLDEGPTADEPTGTAEKPPGSANE